MGITINARFVTSGGEKPASPALALGCMALFLFPFGAAGISSVLVGAKRAIDGNIHNAGVLLLVGSVFTLVAGAGYTALWLGRRKLQEQEQLKARHPDQPWLWRPDWATRQIRDSMPTALWGSWFFSALWNSVSFPAAALAVRQALQLGNRAAYVALVFPIVGIGLLVWAIRNTLRFRRDGISVLELSTLPAVIGHSLIGRVRASSLLQPADGFHVVLSCVRRVTSKTGDDSSTTETILWQEEKGVRGELNRDPRGMATFVPIGFQIPGDVRGSDPTVSNDYVLWRLTLSAVVPGVDYQSVFEVPVFRTSASDSAPTDEDRRAGAEQALRLAEYRQPADSRISVSRNRRGVELNFPAARNPGAALGLSAFTLLWGGIVAALIRFHVPLLFPIVFGAFGLLLVVGALELWLTVSRVVVDKGSISVAQGYLYAGSEKMIGSAQIASVTTKISMQAGSRPYYDVVLVTTAGKQIAAGRWVRNKREAEWLAATLKEELGLLRRRSEVPAGHDPRHVLG
ncbi:MAG: hypothetical protein ACJ8CN_09545 [Gemmatimonadales bacterium]